MIKNFGIILIVMMALLSCTSNSNEEVDAPVQLVEDENTVSYIFDPLGSSVDWSADMLGMYSHSGTLNFADGELTTRDGVIISGVFVVDMNSIEASDANFSEESGKSRKDLVYHLKSSDFFNTEEFPTARLDIKSMDENKLMGVLEIKGVKKEIVIENVELYPESEMFSAKVEFSFNRQDFGISYSTGIADMVISDDVKVLVKVLFTK